MLPSISRLPALGLAILAYLTFLQSTLALQANLAGIVDWHKPFIGVPLLDPSPPSIIHCSNGDGRRILAITKKNVFACLGERGEVLWRYMLDQEDPVISYHQYEDEVLLLSGPGATTARLFNFTTGRAIWEKPLHRDIQHSHLTNPVHLGTDASFTHEGSVVILSDGRRITKLSRKDGEALWSMDAPGAGSSVLFKQLLVSDTVIHVLALTSSFASQTLTSLTLSLDNSVPVGDFTQIPSIIEVPSDAHLAAADQPGGARIVWFEHGRIRTVYLGPTGFLGNTKDLLPGKGRKYSRVLDASARREGWILGQMGNGAVDVIDVRDGGKIVTTFEGSEDSADKSPSVYSATKTSDGVTFNRVFWSFKHNWAVFETNSLSSAGDMITSGYSFAFNTAAHGTILAVGGSSNIVPSTLSNKSQLPSIIVTTSSGAISLITPDTIAWTREESLTELAGVKFIDLGEPEVEETRHLLAEESFIARLTRHLTEFKDLPNYLIRWIKRFSSASYTSALASSPLSPTNLHRDQFGFQKLLVAVTMGGKLIAMDSSNGNIIWAKNLGMTSGNGTELHVEGVWRVREGEEPVLAVLATRILEKGTSTVAFHVDALTGQVHGEKEQNGLPRGTSLFEGKSSSSFLVPHKNCGTGVQVLAVVDSSQVMHIFPSCNTVASKISESSSNLFFSSSQNHLTGPILKGLSPSASHINTSWTQSTIWTRPFSQGEIITSQIPVQYEVIASVGRALGDKSTLYKYLNPHLSVITTIKSTDGTSSVYVMDSTNGNTVYSAVVDGSELQAIMVENWLVFTWKEGGRWKLTSVELFEDREKASLESPGVSSFAGKHHVQAVSKTFIMPSGVKALSVTSSKFGITAKELLYVNSQNQITAIPRRLLDPRRPVGKPSKADQEEFLIPYDPILPYDPKRIISHNYPLLGTTNIVSSPALVESTSLIFSCGLDFFLTRGYTPSGTFDILSDSFNKVQLLLTLGGLSAGIAVAKPAVQKKMLRMKWY